MKGLTDLIRTLAEANDIITTQYVYSEIEGGELIKLPASALVITYGRPKYQHSVRAIIDWLDKNGELHWIARGTYKKGRSSIHSYPTTIPAA